MSQRHPEDGSAAGERSSLTVDLPAALLTLLTMRAEANNRTPTGEALHILQDALAVRADPRSDAQFLVERLGATLVAALTGSKDSSLTLRWATADGPLPDAASADRLALGAAIWGDLSPSIGDAATRQWFVSHHRLLGGDTPLLAIRGGRKDQLDLAVAAVLTSAALAGPVES